MPTDGTTTGDDANTGTGSDGGGDGHIDPRTGKPIIIMAYAVSGASCVYIIDTICTWANSI